MKRMIVSSLDPNLLDWTYGSKYEGRKYDLACDIVRRRQDALDSGVVEEWKDYRSWVKELVSMFSNVFDNVRELEEWALKQVKYRRAW